MKAIEFEEQTHKIAEHQEQYETIPAHIDRNGGVVTCCFEFTDEEIEEITKTKKLWHSQLTALEPMQPILLATKKPDFTQSAPESKIITG